MAKAKKGTNLNTLDRTKLRTDEFHARENVSGCGGTGRVQICQ